MVFFQTYLKVRVTCVGASWLACKYCTAPITTTAIRLFAINVLNRNQFDFECAGAKDGLIVTRAILEHISVVSYKWRGGGTQALHMTKTPFHPQGSAQTSNLHENELEYRSPKQAFNTKLTRHRQHYLEMSQGLVIRQRGLFDRCNMKFDFALSHRPCKSLILHRDQLNVRNGKGRC